MKNPIIQVSVDHELRDVIRRIAKCTGTSASGFTASLLKAQRDVLIQLADTLEKARDLSMPLSRDLIVKMEIGEDEVQQLAHDAQAKLDQLMLDIDGQNEDQNTAPRAARAEGAPRARGAV